MGEKIILGSVVVVAVLLVAFLVFGRNEPAAQGNDLEARTQRIGVGDTMTFKFAKYGDEEVSVSIRRDQGTASRHYLKISRTTAVNTAASETEIKPGADGGPGRIHAEIDVQEGIVDVFVDDKLERRTDILKDGTRSR